MSSKICSRDVSVAVAAMSTSKRRKYTIKAQARGLTLTEYLLKKLDRASVDEAEARLRDLGEWDAVMQRVGTSGVDQEDAVPKGSAEGSDEGEEVHDMLGGNKRKRLDVDKQLEDPEPSIAPAGPAEPCLTAEQEKVVNAIGNGANVFYTGSAGTGKSTVLKAFVERLKDQGRSVSIVAPSGIAALAVGGTTFFAYAGWTPDLFKLPSHKLLERAHGLNVRKRLCSTDCLVIDEISMVERDLLVRLDRLMREARNGYRPEGGRPATSKHSKALAFGGVQVVVTGDFNQLQPVRPFQFCIDCGGDELPGWRQNSRASMTCPKCGKVHRPSDRWAYASKSWEDCNFTYIELSKIHRQDDATFIDILQTCRRMQPLSARQRMLLTAPKPDPVGAVRLLPRRIEVERENTINFARLPSMARSFDCLDMFLWQNQAQTPELKWKGEPKDPSRRGGPLKALADHRFEEHIDVKEGMLVILLVNLDFEQGLVNGSQGKVVGFEAYDPNKKLVTQAPGRDSPPSRKRSRGQSSPPSKWNIRHSARAGEHAQKVCALKEQQCHNFIERAAVKEWPVVRFRNGVVRTIHAHCQFSELGSEEPYSLLGRTQLPLLASWAITIHKSQGMTLSSVIVDLGNSFERGMVYVALSRAKNLQGLKVLRMPDMSRTTGDEEVSRFLMDKFGRP